MNCNWCESTLGVRWVLAVYLCEYCRVHWLTTGTTRGWVAKENL